MTRPYIPTWGDDADVTIARPSPVPSVPHPAPYVPHSVVSLPPLADTQGDWDIVQRMADWLNLERAKRRLNQREFADLLGMDRSLVHGYLTGHVGMTLRSLGRICDRLNVSIVVGKDGPCDP